MKLVRPLLIGLAALVVLLAIAVSLVFTSAVQTWAVRRTLASHPDLKGTVGSVSGGLQQVEIKDARIERNGAVLTLPALHAELPVTSAAFGNKVSVSRLVAKGWVLDLSQARPSAAPAKKTARSVVPRPREFSLVGSAFAADPIAASAAARVFDGIFSQLQLPVELSLDGVELEGQLILATLPDRQPTRLNVTLRGGGLAAGQEGKFTFTLATAAPAGVAPVSAVALRGTLTATMDTAHSFTRLGASAEASASGTQFPRGVKLNADLSAVRDAKGENYQAAIVGEGRHLLTVRADFPVSDRAATPSKLTGAWDLDVRDADLVPFALGVTLPAFSATGEGNFDADSALAEIHTSGKLNANADKLETLYPELAAVGAVRVSATFDGALHGDAIRVDRLTAEVAGASPVATVRALQPFEFNSKTTDLKVADPAQDLLGITLEGLPLAWLKPFLSGYSVEGEGLKGELTASARDGGATVQAKSPLTIERLSVAQGNKPLLREVDLSLQPSADYTPQGWQVVIAPLTAKSGATKILNLEAKAGRRAGKDQPIKATGVLSVHLPSLLAQPALAGLAQLQEGEVSLELAGSFGARQELQARLTVNQLAADPALSAEKLPSVTADIRVDREAGGKITFVAPFVVERDGRKSDLNLAGTLTAEKSTSVVDAHVTSELLVVDDVKILGAPFAGVSPVPEKTGEKSEPGVTAGPPWAGLKGKVTLALKKIVYSDSFEIGDLNGTLLIDDTGVKLEGMRAGMGDNGEAKLAGGVTFDAKTPEPYALALNFTASEFDPGPLFRAINPGQPPTVEGKFNASSKLTGRAKTLADVAGAASGDIQLTSKGGVFRGLPVSVAAKAELTSKIAAGVASLGNLATALTGKSDKALADITSVAQAVAELTKYWQAISYDQLSVVVSRDASLNTQLKDFSLIGPEIRLTGGGQATHQPGKPLLEESLAMEFKVRARGHHADLLKYIGVLDAHPDDLGYAGCTLPLKVVGTLGKPDTSELQHKLTAIIAEKSGFPEYLDKIFGK